MRPSWAVLLLMCACAGGKPGESEDGGKQGGDAGVVEAVSEDAGQQDTCIPHSFTDACAAIEASVFESVDKLECGVCPPGAPCEGCHWQLRFGSRGRYDWQHSDYVESGSYTCAGLEVTGTGHGVAYGGRYALPCDRLTWDGVSYRRREQ